MKLIRINQIPYSSLEDFLMENPEIEGRKLLNDGFAVMKSDKMIGCFILESTDTDDSYWLKKVYITQFESKMLPVLIESILVFSKQQEAKRIYVYSHQPVVNLLLETLQFNPQKMREYMLTDESIEGNWWAYQVS